MAYSETMVDSPREDPYRELELYLERATEEIGRVFRHWENPKLLEIEATSPVNVHPKHPVQRRTSCPALSSPDGEGSPLCWEKGMWSGKPNYSYHTPVLRRPVSRISPRRFHTTEIDYPATRPLHKNGLQTSNNMASMCPRDTLSIWTAGLMAEFHRIVDRELQILGSGRGENKEGSPDLGDNLLINNDGGDDSGADEVFLTPTSSPITRLPPVASSTERLYYHYGRSQSVDNSMLSPWARAQLRHLEDSSYEEAGSHPSSALALAQRSSSRSRDRRRNSNRKKSVGTTIEGGIKSPEQSCASMDEITMQMITHGSQKVDRSVSTAQEPRTCDVHAPYLRPQELQDFMKRVEEGIRTTSSVSEPLEDEERAREGDFEEDDDGDKRPERITFDLPADGCQLDAMTQTSPTSLSRSSSFLWVLSADETASLAVRSLSPKNDDSYQDEERDESATPNSLLVSATLSLSRRSLPDTEAQTDVNLNTSIGSSSCPSSSLISGSSGLGFDPMRADEDVDDADLAFTGRSRKSTPQDGVESGIGTGSPPPRDRRRRNHKLLLPSSTTDDTEESDRSSASHGGNTNSSNTTSGSPRKGKLRRKETWEKLRRRQSCKRTPSSAKRSTNIVADPDFVVWVKREDLLPDQSPTNSCTNNNNNRICHKPPAPSSPICSERQKNQRNSSSNSQTIPRNKNLGWGLKADQAESSQSTPSNTYKRRDFSPPLSSPASSTASSAATPHSIKSALQAVLSLELGTSHKSSSAPALKPSIETPPSPREKLGKLYKVGSRGSNQGNKKKNPMPFIGSSSASSTPTDPHITMEATLSAARSHSESAFAEIEAAEACRWLRAAGFPQYAQMYEEFQFPLDLTSVRRDHAFLDVDSLQALYRRLTALNRAAKMRLDAAPRKQVEDSDDDETQCALSENWTFERDSRRWSRVVLGLGLGTDKSEEPEMLYAGEIPKLEFDLDPEDGTTLPSLVVETVGGAEVDPVVAASFRRSSSERWKNGARSLLKRMGSLRSRSRKRPPVNHFLTIAGMNNANGEQLTIGSPQVLDVPAMQERMKGLNCVELSAPNSLSSTPSPDLGTKKVVKQIFLQHELPLSDSECVTFSPTRYCDANCNESSDLGEFQGGKWRKSQRAGRRDRSWDSSRGMGLNTSGLSTSSTSSHSSPHKRTALRRQRSLNEGKESKSFRERLHLNFKAGKSKSPNSTPVQVSPDDLESSSHIYDMPIIIRNTNFQETPNFITPVAKSKFTSYLAKDDQDTTSTGTSSSGSHADCELEGSPQQSRGGSVVRWHSFRRSSGLKPFTSPGSPPGEGVPMESLSVGQFALLKKLALLRLTALLERHASSNKPAWGWDLPKFMRKHKNPDYKGKHIFGVPLGVNVQRTGEPLPLPILEALQYLHQHCLDQIGLFRKSGVRSRITKLKELLESGTPVDFADHQAYDVADMVKQYFRDLPDPLFTSKLSETFITIFQIVPPALRIEALQCGLLLLPDEHREALQTLVHFLVGVASWSSTNQMTPSNLAVCLAPSLFHLPGSSPTPSPSHTGHRRRKTVGVPDAKELSENKASHECLLAMIQEWKLVFQVPDDMLNQCRFTFLELSVPVTLEELKTSEHPDWRSYMQACVAALMKESKEKLRGWVAANVADSSVEVAYKKVGDGHTLRLWRATTEIDASPQEVLHRILRERHVWDRTLQEWRVLSSLDKQAEVFHYMCAQQPNTLRDYCLLRTWRSDLPRGACVLVETSVEHPDAPQSCHVMRGIVLASRFLIESVGNGKSRLVHLSRVDTKGRCSEWYTKMYGSLCALEIVRIRDSFQSEYVQVSDFRR